MLPFKNICEIDIIRLYRQGHGNTTLRNLPKVCLILLHSMTSIRQVATAPEESLELPIRALVCLCLDYNTVNLKKQEELPRAFGNKEISTSESSRVQAK